VFVDTARLFVHEETLVCLHQLGFAIEVIEVTHELMRIKVVLFYAEGSGNLTVFVHFVRAEHLLEVQVLDNRSGVLVEQVTALIRQITLLVTVISTLTLADNSISIFISVKFTKNIVDVESSQVSIWWHINRLLIKLVLNVRSHVHSLVHLRVVVLERRRF
jgi:hypothetical protein